MRARNIKPGYFRNDALAELPPLTRLLWAGLWCYADWRGNLEERPAKIKAEVLPYDTCDVVAMIAALVDSGFLRRYEVDGVRYLHIPRFLDHQNPHKNERLRGSKIPPFSDGDRNGDGPEPPTVSAEDDTHTDSSQENSVPIRDENGSRPADSGLLITDTGLLIADAGLPTAPVASTDDQANSRRTEPRSAAVLPLRTDRFAMAAGWAPGEGFAGRLVMAGCSAPKEFWQDCLPEFILFREARRELFTQSLWEHKFLQDVLHKFGRCQSERHAQSPQVIPPDWEPNAEAWAVLDRRGIERQFALEKRDDFVLFWRDAGAVKRSWNAAFVDFVCRRWSERQPERMSTWESYTDTSWADGVALALPTLEGAR